MDPGTCGSMATFWYADGSGGCHQYPNGCIGVPEGNAFASEAECQATCPATAEEICNLPAAAGGYVPGAGAVRWYSKANGLCDTFQYTGNDGNANNFYTEEDCYATCPAPPPVPALGGGRGPVAAALVLLMLAVAAALLRRSTDAKSGHSRAHSRAFRPIPFRNLPSPRCSSTP